MATTKEQLRNALVKGDSQEDLVCFYQPIIGADGEVVNLPGLSIDECGDPIRCTFDELPERDFYVGFGSYGGEPCIAFSPRYVYIKIQYDGLEWFEAIPRHPEQVVKPIPWPGE